MKKTFIFDQGLFQHHLLSLPPSLLTLSREGPRTFSPLVLTLGLVALYIWQSENGQRGIFFFFHENIKFIWKLTKTSVGMSLKAYCLKLCSPWYFAPYLLILVYFPRVSLELTIVSENIVGNIFPLWFLFAFHLFLHVHVFWVESCKRRKELNSYYSDKIWKAQWASCTANYSILLPLLFYPL